MISQTRFTVRSRNAEPNRGVIVENWGLEIPLKDIVYVGLLVVMEVASTPRIGLTPTASAGLMVTSMCLANAGPALSKWLRLWARTSVDNTDRRRGAIRMESSLASGTV